MKTPFQNVATFLLLLAEDFQWLTTFYVVFKKDDNEEKAQITGGIYRGAYSEPVSRERVAGMAPEAVRELLTQGKDGLAIVRLAEDDNTKLQALLEENGFSSILLLRPRLSQAD